MDPKRDDFTNPEELETPSYLSSDYVTDDDGDDDAIDRMAMDSFPASDPPSFSATAMGAPLRGKAREPQRDRESRSATGVAILRDVRTIVSSTFRIARARLAPSMVPAAPKRAAKQKVAEIRAPGGE